MGLAEGDVQSGELGTFKTPMTKCPTLDLSIPCLHERDRTLMNWGNTRAFIETNTCTRPVRDRGNCEKGKLCFCVIQE